MQQQLNRETAQQTMLVTWAAILMSQVFFVGIVYFIKPELFTLDAYRPLLGDDPMMVAMLGVLAVSAVIAGRFMHSSFLKRSVDQQNLMLVQTATIVGSALSEAASLLGLVAAFVADHSFFWVFVVLGVIGTLLSYPSKRAIQDASFRS
jgi:F0F1-type ATP synthase membrane subunit c/vacuolar-type H+-ATPase subunit K